MKKLMILLAVSCLIFVSCGTKTQSVVEQTEETTCPYQAALEQWENWENLDAEAQVALVGELKAFFDECCKAKCEEKCEAKEGEEVCPEKAAKCAEFKAKWEAFETLTLEEQKELLDVAIAHKAKCCEGKKEGGCCKDKEETCDKD
jgi:hypothetical protein